jgi:hypothetical protein
VPDAPTPSLPIADTAAHPALPGDEPRPLPGEDAVELDLLRRAITNDWGPRDAYERHWTGELVSAMRRQQLLRGLELKALAAAEAASPPTEAAVQRLLAFARYGARLDRDLGAALRALRVLRNRPDAWIEETHKSTLEPKSRTAAPPRTPEPDRHAATAARTSEPEPAPATTRTPEPERPAALGRQPSPPAPRTPEPDAPIQPPLNRHERRRLEALQRQAGRRAA